MRLLRALARGRRRRPLPTPPLTERAVVARLHPRTGQVQVWPSEATDIAMQLECPHHPDPDCSLTVHGRDYFCHACGRGGRLRKDP